MSLAVLVGENHTRSPDPALALIPDSPRLAGGRLCFKILGMTAEDYLAAFDRVNLCPTGWDARAARLRATVLRATGRRLVLLGARAARAFGLAYKPFERPAGLLVLPHPSGRCRAWNAADAVARARAAVLEYIPELTESLGTAGEASSNGGFSCAQAERLGRQGGRFGAGHV